MSEQYCGEGKSFWPELVGVDGEIAAATIEEESKYVEAIVVREGRAVIQDFRCNRVWVWVDSNGCVSRVPKIG